MGVVYFCSWDFARGLEFELFVYRGFGDMTLDENFISNVILYDTYFIIIYF